MRLLSLIALLALGGCASANLSAFRDPAYPDARFTKIAVFAFGVPLEYAVATERQVCEKIAPAACVQGRTVLPPTRGYTGEEINEYLGRAGIDGVLIVTYRSDRAQTSYLGTVTTSSTQGSSTSQGSANLYGNTATYSESGQSSEKSQSLSTPVYSYSRLAYADVSMFERSSGNIAWRGELRISGQGYVNVSNGAFTRSATSKVASALVAAGLVAVPPH